jgi:hypothetical protein
MSSKRKQKESPEQKNKIEEDILKNVTPVEEVNCEICLSVI